MSKVITEKTISHFLIFKKIQKTLDEEFDNMLVVSVERDTNIEIPQDFLAIKINDDKINELIDSEDGEEDDVTELSDTRVRD